MVKIQRLFNLFENLVTTLIFPVFNKSIKFADICFSHNNLCKCFFFHFFWLAHFACMVSV